VVSFTNQPLYPPGKSPRYPWDRRLGGPQSRSGRGGEEKVCQKKCELNTGQGCSIKLKTNTNGVWWYPCTDIRTRN